MFTKFEGLKKQLFEKWQNFENRLLESNTFNLLKEKYQSLDIFQQKLIKYLFALSITVILAYFPISYLLSSLSYWKELKEKQNLSLELLQIRKHTSFSAFPYSQIQLKSQIEQIIKKYSSSPFKLQDKKTFPQPNTSIYQVDFDIHLKHLNVKQAIKMGTELHNLYQARLSSITMTENKEFPKHYDVAYQVLSFVRAAINNKTQIKSPPIRQKPLSTPKQQPTFKNKNLKPKPFRNNSIINQKQPSNPRTIKHNEMRKDKRKKIKKLPTNTNKNPAENRRRRKYNLTFMKELN